MIWARMLAYITGTVDQELLLRNEYLAAENRILRAQIQGRLLLSDAERARLAEIAHRLGRKALEELAAVARPDTLLAWYRKLIATKFDGSKFRKSGRRISRVDVGTDGDPSNVATAKLAIAALRLVEDDNQESAAGCVEVGTAEQRCDVYSQPGVGLRKGAVMRVV